MSRGAASSSSRRRWSAPGTTAGRSRSTAFERLGKAYLDFARNEPAYYSAMFEAGVPLDANPELRAAGDRAFGVLRSATETLIATHAGGEPPAGADDGAAYLGAVARHRVAVRRAAMRRGAQLPMSPEELLEAGVLVYLRGLGLPDRRGR